MVTNLEKAEKERDALDTTIKWYQKKMTAHTAANPITIVEVRHYLSELEKLREEAAEIHKRIIIAGPTDENVTTDKYFGNLDEISKLQVKMKDLLARVPTPTPATTPTPPPPGPSSVDIKLPQLELPTFDGNISDWLSFRDMFNASIGKNTKLPDVQKLNYLKRALTGEAARQVRSVVLSDANYSIAWKLLEDRYNNDRELLFSVLRRFTGQSNIHSVSAAALRTLIDTSKECQRYLEVLKQPVKEWDAILLFHIHQKIDNTTRELWEQTLTGGTIPKLEAFLEFLEQRARALAAGSNSKSKAAGAGGKADGGAGGRHHAHFAQSTPSCKLCSGDHFIQKCEKFKQKSIDDRISTVKQINLCYNCLRSGHGISTCSSKSTCRECQRKHHTLLHKEKEPKKDNATPNTDNSSNTAPTAHNHFCNDDNSIVQSILATAAVRIPDSGGNLQQCRVLLDGGSTTSFISESCVTQLGLKRRHTNVQVVGLASAAVGTTKGAVTFTIYPHFEKNNMFVVNALILSKVTGRLPGFECDPTVWPHLQGLQLADPDYHLPAGIDILLGADLFYNILQNGQRTGPPNTPVAVRTSLGWLVAGKVSQTACKVTTHHADLDLTAAMERFWELETIPQASPYTEEEERAEQHFLDNHKRLSDGRFMVKLPFKRPKTDLGESREIAVRRLKSMERRLSSHPELKKQYTEFMREYEALGHMTRVNAAAVNTTPNCYIPHHFVLKLSSTTTKLRVVFDASAKTSNGTSLNDIQMLGPVIQDLMIYIIMRFRIHAIAFCCDIEKMYRQILVCENDRSMQRILWREQPTDPIIEYDLNTVTYGEKCASFLSTRALKQLAIEEEDKFPIAAEVLQNDLSVDDCLSGASTLERAMELKTQLLQLTERGQMSLRKWVSNSKELMDSLPPELRELKPSHSISDDPLIKTLGINWNPESDEFIFKVHEPLAKTITNPTKRTTLSEIAKLFDPLGWLAPLIIRGKLHIQELWKLQIGWDEELPLHMQQQWTSFMEDLPKIEAIHIPRCICPESTYKNDLIGFSDASEKAYAAVVYVRAVSQDGDVHVSLIASKTRVAPAKTQTLPRLELCGALLLADLIDSIQEAMGKKMKFDSTTAWTDSTITLAWLRGHPSRWQCFVQNRVAKVQTLLPPQHWNHIAGADNPADCASRGISAEELVNHPLWWQGCSWMRSDGFPSTVTEDFTTEMEERKQAIVNVAQLEEDVLPFDKYSSFKLLKRVTAYTLRFISNLKKKVLKQPLTLGELSVEELDDAFHHIIRRVQQQSFALEYQTLQEMPRGHHHQVTKRNKTIKKLPRNSKILSLNPFMDEKDCIRVGGRLRHAQLPHNQKHPYLLPRHHIITTLIIRNAHFQHCHAAPQALLTILSQQYWIVNGRDTIRQIKNKCVVCTRFAAITQKQFMGDLPAARVTPTRPFSTCGVDFAGPIHIKPMVRSKISIKAYICLFVCFSTRAIHMELVSSLSSDAFLACLRRFISRRGKPSHIYSDMGTNFVGASRELQEMADLLKSTEGKCIRNSAADEGITWHFNPPSAPHFGGLWEAGVKSTKFHLYRVIGSHRLTYEELLTVLNQIEAILNSRPLTPLSTDPNDFQALTPGHFLIGSALTAPPEQDLLGQPQNRLKRWQLLQQMQQSFWKRWSNEFITRLQQRPKWHQQHRNIQQNDMVLIKDDRLSPLQWKLGRVVSCHPGHDGIVRVATIRTGEGEYKRPIVKLCLLPIQESAIENE